MDTHHRKVIAFLLAILISIGVVQLVDDNDDGRTDRIIITIPQKGADVVVQADRDQQQEPDEQQEASEGTAGATVQTPDVHEDARDETPAGVDPAEIAEGKEATNRLADRILEQPEPPAGAQAYSCPPRHVRNQSALSGRRVGTALHFTVSSPGSLDVIRGLFDRSSFGASSNFGIELAGRCQAWVPRGRKAWAQGAANSAYFSIEIVTRDLSRAQWLNAPIIKKGILAALVRDLNRSVGAPLRLVDPKGCTWTPGITDHNRLECGNTHWDVGGAFPWSKFIGDVRRGVSAPPVSKSARRQCKQLNRYRRLDRRGKLPAPARSRAARLKRNLTGHSYVCGLKRGRTVIRKR